MSVKQQFCQHFVPFGHTCYLCYANNSMKQGQSDSSVDPDSLRKNLGRKSPELQPESPKAPQGLKYDSKKPALDLIPTEFLLSVGSVLSFGAQKYDRANWAKGIEYSRLISACLRHVSAFNNGEDVDPESGISHLGHAGCNLAFLTWMTEHKSELDDRWIKQVKK